MSILNKNKSKYPFIYKDQKTFNSVSHKDKILRKNQFYDTGFCNYQKDNMKTEKANFELAFLC